MDRKTFIAKTLGTIGVAAAAPKDLFNFQKTGYKAIAFDAFPIFNTRQVDSLAEEFFPSKGKEISGSWRLAQFQYSWLRTAAGQYRDFMDITRDALVFAARKTGVTLDNVKEEALMNQYINPQIWPDVPEALERFRKAGIRLCFLSNMSPKMLSNACTINKLDGYFEELISTDRIHSYKPDPKAYQLGTDILKLKKEAILFTAFAGWDACGAKWFGYPTFWMNRAGMPEEELQVAADGTGKTMADLMRFAGM
jgi:2-haloacid dehalogenase